MITGASNGASMDDLMRSAQWFSRDEGAHSKHENQGQTYR